MTKLNLLQTKIHIKKLLSKLLIVINYDLLWTSKSSLLFLHFNNIER